MGVALGWGRLVVTCPGENTETETRPNRVSAERPARGSLKKAEAILSDDGTSRNVKRADDHEDHLPVPD